MKIMKYKFLFILFVNLVVILSLQQLPHSKLMNLAAILIAITDALFALTIILRYLITKRKRGPILYQPVKGIYRLQFAKDIYIQGNLPNWILLISCLIVIVAAIIYFNLIKN